MACVRETAAVSVQVVVVVDRFYIALFSALEHTHFALVACDFDDDDDDVGLHVLGQVCDFDDDDDGDDDDDDDEVMLNVLRCQLTY